MYCGTSLDTLLPNPADNTDMLYGMPVWAEGYRGLHLHRTSRFEGVEPFIRLERSSMASRTDDCLTTSAVQETHTYATANAKFSRNEVHAKCLAMRSRRVKIPRAFLYYTEIFFRQPCSTPNGSHTVKRPTSISVRTMLASKS